MAMPPEQGFFFFGHFFLANTTQRDFFFFFFSPEKYFCFRNSRDLVQSDDGRAFFLVFDRMMSVGVCGLHGTGNKFFGAEATQRPMSVVG